MISRMKRLGSTPMKSSGHRRTIPVVRKLKTEILDQMSSIVMKQTETAIAVCTVAAMLVLIAAPARAAAPATFELSGRVVGPSGKKAVYVTLWQADGFLKRPFRQIRIEPGAELVFRFEVPADRWAVSSFEDRNGNGILDMGLFGPKEPSGFWRPFTGWHKPRFDEVASTIEGDTLHADITLK